MSVRKGILQRLTASPNLSVERILEHALRANPSPKEQQELFDIIATRNKRAGWVALIKSYDRLTDEIREQLLERRRELFLPLSEAMQDLDGQTRPNALEIIRRCDDPRLAYLLAQALIDVRQEVRELAGQSLLVAVMQHRELVGHPAAGDLPLDQEAVHELRRAVDYALKQYKTHKETSALLAALFFERQQDAPMWSYFQDPHDELTRTAAAIFRNPPSATAPSIASAALLALTSPLKPAAIAGLLASEDPIVAKSITRDSFRLLDPVLRNAAQAIGQLKVLGLLWKESPTTDENWAPRLRLIECLGIQPHEKMPWLGRLLEQAAAAEKPSPTWKLCVMRAMADTGCPDAGRHFARMLADPSERVARCAARYLLSRRNSDWRLLASSSPCPHASVRRIMGPTTTSGKPAALGERVAAVVAAAAPDSPADPAFAKVWGEYPEMPPAVQHTAARSSSAGDPQFFDQMKAKLASKITTEVAQGLKMISVLPNLSAYRAQIIALCGHPDYRVAGTAVKLVGRLEDPRLKDLLEAAAQHPDPRVRAQAVESMSALHIANHSQKVLDMLHSRHNRERANAIKAISEFDFNTARECLRRMLSDNNPLHRISALWVVQQLELPELFRHVSTLARRDPNIRVRRRAAEMIETLIGNTAEIPAPSSSRTNT